MKSTPIPGGLKRLLSIDLAFWGGSVVIKLVDYDDDDDDDDDGIAGSNPSVLIKLVDYFLNLFPVFTLSTNFPIIAITLRCRLQYFTANVDSSLAQSLYH